MSRKSILLTALILLGGSLILLSNEVSAELIQPDSDAEDTDLYAHWYHTPYTVIWKSQSGSVLETDSFVYYGESPSFDQIDPTLSTTVEKTYTFVGWATSSGQTTGTLEANLPAVTGDVEYYAAFSESPSPYSISFYDSSSVKTNGLSDISTCYGQSIDVPYYPGSPSGGHYFLGWSKTPGASTATYVPGQTMSNLHSSAGENVKLYAVWSTETQITESTKDTYENPQAYAHWYAIPYTVTWKSWDGTVTLEIDSNVTVEDPLSFDGSTPTVSDDGTYTYAFVGWATTPDQTSGTQVNMLSIRGDTTFYAAFSRTLNTYTIVFDKNGAASIDSSIASINAKALENYDVPYWKGTAAAGKQFLGWSKSSTATSATFIPGTTMHDLQSSNGQTVTLYAVWKNIEPISITDKNTYADPELYAHWYRTPYLVTFTLSEGSFAGDAPSGWRFSDSGKVAWKNYTDNTAATFQDAYDAIRSSITGISGPTPDWSSISASAVIGSAGGDIMIEAQSKFTVTVSVASGQSAYGSVSTGSVSNVPHGAQVSVSNNVLTIGETSVTATPATATYQYRYAFDHWEVDGSAIPANYQITADKTITAVFTQEEISYSVGYNVNNASKTSGNATATYAGGLTAVFAASNGYELPNSITVTVGGQTLAATNYTWNKSTGTLSIGASKITGNLQISVTATAKQYTISYNLNDGTVSQTNPTSYYITSSAITLSNPTKVGYQFAGWSGTGLSSDTMTVTIQTGSTGDRTYTANWTANTYYVHFNANKPTNASASISGTMSNEQFSYGTSKALTQNAFSLAGWDFKGWATSSDGIVTYSDKQSVSNLTTTQNATVELFAVWEAQKKVLIYMFDSTIHEEALQVSVDSEVELISKPTKEYYTVSDWSVSTNNATIQNGKFKMPNANVTLVATSTPIDYSIGFTLNGGTAKNTSTYNFETNTFSLNAPTRDGYEFTGWTGSNGNIPEKNISISKGSHGALSYTANWSPIQYTISFELNGGTATNVSSYNIESGSITLNNPTKTGYTFGGWTGTGLSSSSSTVTIASGSTGNRAYTATWSPITYQVQFMPNHPSAASASVTGSMTNQNFTYDASANLTANAFGLSGWTFQGWATTSGGLKAYDGGQSVSNLGSTQGAVIQLFAVWTANTDTAYKVKHYQQSLDGDYVLIDTDDLKGTTDTSATVTSKGYTGFGTPAYTSANIMGDGSTVIDVHYERLSYAVTIAGEGLTVQKGEAGVTSGDTVKFGAQLNITIASKPGYDGIIQASVGNVTEGAYTMGASVVTFTGSYQIATYNITFSKADASFKSGFTAPSTYTIVSSAIALPTGDDMTREGYTFVGWYAKPTFVGEKVTSIPAGSYGNVTYYAKWEAAKYGATFDANYTGSSYSRTLVQTYGSAYQFPDAPTQKGYTFAGWYTEKSAGSLIDGESVFASLQTITLYAHWTAKTYDVYFKHQNNTDDSTMVSQTYGAKFALPETNPTFFFDNTSWTFDGWYTQADGGQQITADTVVSITDDTILYAHWSSTKGSIAYNEDGGHTVTTVKVTGSKETTSIAFYDKDNKQIGSKEVEVVAKAGYTEVYTTETDALDNVKYTESVITTSANVTTTESKHFYNNEVSGYTTQKSRANFSGSITVTETNWDASKSAVLSTRVLEYDAKGILQSVDVVLNDSSGNKTADVSYVVEATASGDTVVYSTVMTKVMSDHTEKKYYNGIQDGDQSISAYLTEYITVSVSEGITTTTTKQYDSDVNDFTATPNRTIVVQTGDGTETTSTYNGSVSDANRASIKFVSASGTIETVYQDGDVSEVRTTTVSSNPDGSVSEKLVTDVYQNGVKTSSSQRTTTIRSDGTVQVVEISGNTVTTQEKDAQGNLVSQAADTTTVVNGVTVTKTTTTVGGETSTSTSVQKQNGNGSHSIVVYDGEVQVDEGGEVTPGDGVQIQSSTVRSESETNGVKTVTEETTVGGVVTTVITKTDKSTGIVTTETTVGGVTTYERSTYAKVVAGHVQTFGGSQVQIPLEITSDRGFTQLELDIGHFTGTISSVQASAGSYDLRQENGHDILTLTMPSLTTSTVEVTIAFSGVTDVDGQYPVYISGSAYATESDRTYSINLQTVGSMIIVKSLMIGDIDGNGEVDILDWLDAMDAFDSGQTTSAMDVNADGVVDETDLDLIMTGPVSTGSEGMVGLVREVKDVRISIEGNVFTIAGYCAELTKSEGWSLIS